MKRRALAAFVLVFVLAVAARGETQEKLSVAVFDFTSNVGPVLPKDITALITADLSAEPRITLVERARLKKALGEQALGLSGNIDFGAAAKVGQLTGAKVLVAGRAIKVKNELVIIANLVGSETSRIYSEKVEGSATNLLGLTSDLTQKIVATILAQSTNFIAHAKMTRETKIAEIAAKLPGSKRPAVSISISEKIPPERGVHRTTQNELAVVLQKAGFSVVDEKSERRPDVIITGSAVVSTGEKNGNLFSARATIDIKAQERTTGKIISIDRQDGAGLDIGRHTAARLALESAADELAVRLLPLLAQ